MREKIVALLTEGKSMRAICALDEMPSRETVRQWQLSDEAFALAVTHAREEGYHAMAEQAVADAETATDPATGRLKFDARRWYLGKLSNAFSDTKTQKHEHDVKLEAVKRVIYDPRNPDSEGVSAASG